MKQLLIRAYSSLDIYTRTLVEHSLRKAGKPSLDQLILDEPWSVYVSISSVMGRHNADVLIAKIHRAILSIRSNQPLDIDELRSALSSRDGWAALASRFCGYAQ